MIDRVLVPLDGSRRAEIALRAASALVKPAHGALVLVHALASSRLRDRERRTALRYLDRVAARLRREGLHVERRLRIGEPSRAIIRAAEMNDVDLIAISGRGRGGAGTGPLGSVAERVVRSSPIPVLLIRRSAKIRRVLVPFDRSGPAMEILVAVGKAARPLGASVALLRAGSRNRKAIARALDVLTRLEVPGRVTVRSGLAAESLERAARRVGTDLVALAVPHGDRHVALGSRIERLLRDSEQALLIVRGRDIEVRRGA